MISTDGGITAPLFPLRQNQFNDPIPGEFECFDPIDDEDADDEDTGDDDLIEDGDRVMGRITEAVFNRLHGDAKFGGANKELMWAKYTWNEFGKTIYGSNWTWKV
jgi:hypothetical protein